VLVAILAASCASDDSPDATASPPSTTIAASTVTATAGRTVRGTGYSFSLPPRWRDVTTKAKKNFSEKIDLAVVGPPAGGVATNLNVIVGQARGATLAAAMAATRKEQAEALPDVRLLGQVEQLSLAGTPAMAHEYTFTAEGNIPAHGRQVVCLRDGRVLFVTFTAHQQAFTSERAALDQILTSWSWG
jgi:hypothetical protein